MKFEIFQRRRFLAVALSAYPLIACSRKQVLEEGKSRMMPIEMTPQEFKLLEDPAERKRVLGDQPLTITGKLLGPPHRLDNATLKDVHFIDCDFLGHYMFTVDMTNVSFTRCAISGVRWEGGRWSDVSFVECVGKGKGDNIIAGGGAGTMIYEKCNFSGDDPKTPDDNDFTEIRGGIGAAGKSRFIDCELRHMTVNIIGEAVFKNCKFISVSIDQSLSKVPIDRVSIEDCSCVYSLDLSNNTIYSLSMRNGSYHQVDLTYVRSNGIILENVKGNFDLNVVDTLKFLATNCLFKASTNELDRVRLGGLTAPISRFDDAVLIDCNFEGGNSILSTLGEQPELDGHGKIIPRFNGEHKPLAYFSEFKTLTIKNTPITNANLSYTHIGHLTLENTSFSNSEISHSDIGELTLKNVKLSGKLDFTDTRVRKVTSEAVVKEGLDLVKDKKTDIELTASLADKLPGGVRKWFS